MPDQTDSGVCSHGIVALASISNLADGQDSTDPGVCSHGIVALASISNLAYGQDSVYWPWCLFSQDGVVLGESSRWKFIDEEENHTLVIYEVQPEDAGQYACVAINSVGKSTCTARLDVESECLSLSAVSLGERICCCCCCFSFLMRELVFWKGLVLSEFFGGGSWAWNISIAIVWRRCPQNWRWDLKGPDHLWTPFFYSLDAHALLCSLTPCVPLEVVRLPSSRSWTPRSRMLVASVLTVHAQLSALSSGVTKT